jgi:hypothetical protein
MIVLLSPAKAMASTFRGHVPPQGPTLPPFLTSHTDALLQRCKQLKSSDIAAAMKISKELADLNHARFQAFVTAGDKKGAAALETAQKTFATTQLVPDAQFKICALAFDGPAFRGFNAAAMSADEFAQASAHVCILSGLYGCLRPTDMIQEYRLEMGTKMKVNSRACTHAATAVPQRGCPACPCLENRWTTRATPCTSSGARPSPSTSTRTWPRWRRARAPRSSSTARPRRYVRAASRCRATTLS